MKPTSVTAFRGALRAEGIVLEFGRSVAAEGAAAAFSASDRVLLTPQAAERLLVALDLALLAPGAAAAPSVPVARPVDPQELMRRGMTPVHVPADEAAVLASALLDGVAELGAPWQYERSFRMATGSLLGNRFLMTVARRDLGPEALPKVLALCTRLGMPQAAAQAAAHEWEQAAGVHFGFEGSPGGAVCKLYLEQVHSQDAARRAFEMTEPLQQHVAWKWRAGDAQAVVTRYLWRPLLSAEQIAQRLATVYEGAADPLGLAAAREALETASARNPSAVLQYLEVQEEGSPRRSFDLNLYDAGLRVQDIRAVLSRLRERHGIRPGQFQALYDQVKGQPLGHVAGGVHRDGQDFFTVYHVAPAPRGQRT
ncbi:MAG TPA: hypothetical protein VLJ62_21925 [Burkholderiaceae bacterium]|nr:hypothetical protein [Burkholderiaceae bacterium]